MRCDCGDQLQEAISLMNDYYQKPNEQGFSGGIILYIMQEGRGIGLTNKLRTYDLQSKGHDTVEANRKLGFEDDERQFIQAASILRDLKIENVHLLSNNPRKSRILDELGIHVKDTVSHFVESNEHNKDYLKTKEERLGHKF
ncbi:MAG: GTP cyclohydrolase II, partial [Rickettsiales bacterium]|nr:GTP cyclohydrolase II [Rickettsiales bacterium]